MLRISIIKLLTTLLFCWFVHEQTPYAWAYCWSLPLLLWLLWPCSWKEWLLHISFPPSYGIFHCRCWLCWYICSKQLTQLSIQKELRILFSKLFVHLNLCVRSMIEIKLFMCIEFWNQICNGWVNVFVLEVSLYIVKN